MKPKWRLEWFWFNWIPIVAIILAVGMKSTAILYQLSQLKAKLSPGQAQDSKVDTCYKVSDFYAVHLTTYYLAGTGNSRPDQNDPARKYDQYCDRLPGTGRAIFSVSLLEQDAREIPIRVSFSQYASEGKLKLVKELPPDPHPQGVLTLDGGVLDQGKYQLTVAFGEGKSQDDIIEVPIVVGQ